MAYGYKYKRISRAEAIRLLFECKELFLCAESTTPSEFFSGFKAVHGGWEFNKLIDHWIEYNSVYTLRPDKQPIFMEIVI